MEDQGGRTGRIDGALRRQIFRAHELQHGDRIAGRYRVDALIGSGMSDVYRALDERRGGEVAVKVLSSEQGDPAGESLERRLGLLLRLDHPGLVRILDVGESGGLGFVVTELLDGETLKERVRSDGAVPAERAVRWIVTVLAALEYLHGCGVVHRDVKPQNIMLTSEGPKLLDYGLARRLGVPESANAARMGTLEYMSPEQLRGEEVDHRADLYGCAAVLYEALTGSPPFTGEESTRGARTPPAFPAAAREALPAELRRTVLAAMAVDPAERFATAGEMRAALAPFAEPLPAPSAATRARLRRRALDKLGRRLERLGPALLALGALLAGAAAWWCSDGDRQAPSDRLRETTEHVRMRESFRQ